MLINMPVKCLIRASHIGDSEFSGDSNGGVSGRGMGDRLGGRPYGLLTHLGDSEGNQD